MKKTSIIPFAFFGLTIIVAGDSCKKDDPVPAPPVVVTNQSFTQSFENIDSAAAQGWKFKNLSDDANGGWMVAPETGNGIAAFDGSNLLYSDYTASGANLSTHPDAVISNWAISPKLLLQNGDKISFYTVSHGSIGYGASGSYGDRLQLRLNVFNGSDSIGTTAADIGNFTRPLVDVNPLYKVTGPGDYPTTWTKYEATISGLNQPDSGRFALRYFVQLNGGSNGDELAIDKVEFKTAGY
jgi:hypothetical protein